MFTERQQHAPQSYSALLSDASRTLAEALRASRETDRLVGSLENYLESTGIHFPMTSYSLVVQPERSFMDGDEQT